MKPSAKSIAVVVLVASIAAASLGLAQVTPVQQTKVLQPRPVLASPPSEDLQLQTPEAKAAREMAQLKRENEKLRAENAELRARNDQLRAQVEGYSVLGGSLVHAYCPAEDNTVSRNTAGAQTNCAAGGYTCEPVTGQCRTSCQVSDHCAANYTCDVGRCVRSG